MKNPSTNQELTTKEEKLEFLKNAESLTEIYNSQITKKELDELEDQLPPLLYVMTDVVIEDYGLGYLKQSLLLFTKLKAAEFNPYAKNDNGYLDILSFWSDNLKGNCNFDFLFHPKTLENYPDILNISFHESLFPKKNVLHNIAFGSNFSALNYLEPIPK